MEIKMKSEVETVKNFEDGYYKARDTLYCIKGDNLCQLYVGDTYKSFVCEGYKFNVEPTIISEREWLEAVANILYTIRMTMPDNVKIKLEKEKCNHEFEDSNESNCCGANIPMYPDMDICGDCHEHCEPQRYCKLCGEPEE